MTERLLQFIWRMQYFNHGNLETTKGESIVILDPGKLNLNQGPDFYDARIKINGTLWAGTVELHIKTSGWDQHGHAKDPNFNNVILHVVWENDLPKHPLPVIQLAGRVPRSLISRYEDLLSASTFIPCEASIGNTDRLLLQSWKDRLLAERMLKKAEAVLKMHTQSNQNWQEMYWWLLARNFGHAVNADAFEAIARSVSCSMIGRLRPHLNQIEAVLLGQAGLLEVPFADPYPASIQDEYRFIRRKYNLKPIHHALHFLRMRPANFPTIRLAQLAKLLSSNGHLLEHIRDSTDVAAIRDIFNVSVGEYWETHYLPDRPSVSTEKKLGSSMLVNILVNTVVPVLYAYGKFHSDDRIREKGLKWLKEIQPEMNSIIKNFRNCGIACRHAGESQALLELKNNYCDKRRCLDCGIGNFLLQRKENTGINNF